jgi:hypothetical protein
MTILISKAFPLFFFFFFSNKMALIKRKKKYKETRRRWGSNKNLTPMLLKA